MQDSAGWWRLVQIDRLGKREASFADKLLSVRSCEMRFTLHGRMLKTFVQQGREANDERGRMSDGHTKYWLARSAFNLHRSALCSRDPLRILMSRE